MPTALPTPWPSGPVVVSTPAVWPCSGWPGVLLPQVRSALRSSSSRPKPAEVELDVEGEAGVPGGEHEPVAAGPVRVGRVVPHHLLEQQVRRRAPGSSRCRGGRCRPSARRPSRAPATVSTARWSRSVQSSLLTGDRSSHACVRRLVGQVASGPPRRRSGGRRGSQPDAVPHRRHATRTALSLLTPGAQGTPLPRPPAGR